MKKSIFTLVFAFVLFVFSQGQILNVNRAIVQSDPETYGRELLFYLTQADNLMLQGQYEQAILNYDNAIAQAPDFAEGYIRRAMAKYKLSRFTEAQEDYMMATRLNPYIGDVYGYQNDMRKLQILAFNPLKFIQLPTLKYRLLYYHEIYNTSFETNEKLEAEPTENYLIHKTLHYLKSGDLETALATLNGLESSENSMIFDLKGMIYNEKEDWELAEVNYRKAIDLDETYELAILNLSMLKVQKGDLKTALALVNKVIATNPDFQKAYFYKATIYKKMGENEKALEEYKLMEQQEDFVSYEIFLNRAIAQKMSGDALSALSDMNKAIELKPQNADLYKLRGNIYVLLNNYFEAINDYTKAIELNNGFAEAYFNRGIANILAQNRTAACSDFEKSRDLGYEESEDKLSYFCAF
jgi:tetratricopeptide (TPR) repeat protein